MHWVNIEQADVAEQIALHIKNLLENGPVSWFLSGGSNISIETNVLQLLKETGEHLDQLTVLLIDERFGQVGHADSSWQQLKNAGFMIDGPNYIAPFSEHDITLEAATNRYETIVSDQLYGTNYTYALLGMGPDGHTSGILPHSVASEQTQDLVAGYDGGSYQRLTTTFNTLVQLDEVALVAYGKDKWPQLTKLVSEVPLTEQPAQIIKDIEPATIYTDYKPEGN